MRSEAEDNKLFQIIGGRFSYVKSQEVLDRVIVLINGRKIVAIDTEFTRETTYYPILSIIQIALFSEPKSKEYFIIDCLSGLDLTGLLRIISDPEIVKIIHSSRQDLQIFYHQSGFFPRGIVDTQVMANLCGIGFNVGYSRLVLDFIGKELDKKQQRSDWQRRPLTAKQF